MSFEDHWKLDPAGPTPRQILEAMPMVNSGFAGDVDAAVGEAGQSFDVDEDD